MKTHKNYSVNKSISIILIAFLLATNISGFSQVAFNEDDSDPEAHVALDVQSTGASNPKGVLFPNLSETQRNNLPSPATGLVIYNRTTGYHNYYNGTNWVAIDRVVGDAGSASNTGGTNNDEVGVGIGIEDPDNCAMLHINSNNKGILIPRLAADIGSAVEGTFYYNTVSNKIKIEIDGGGTWSNVAFTVQGAANSGTGTASGVIIGSGTVDASAKLEIKSADKGMLIPLLTTTQRNAINDVTEGLLIYNTTDHEIQYFVDSSWYNWDFE